MIHGDYNTWVGPGKGLLHSGTNYQLSKALWSSLKEHNFWELDAAVQRDLMLYREMSLVNFLSNHDVARVATQVEGEPFALLVCRAFDRPPYTDWIPGACDSG